jgi:biotin transporter BioY
MRRVIGVLVFLGFVGCCMWALVSHSWGLLWSVVGGAFLISVIVDAATRKRETPVLFEALMWTTLLGSLIGIIVWGIRYHVWWPLAAWFGALLLVFGGVVQGVQDEQEKADKAELMHRQLRELREKQDRDT